MYPVLFHIGAILIPSYGALAALGVIAALFLAQQTARVAGVHTGHVWNLCVVAVFSALVVQRLLLLAVNWSQVRAHPSLALGLAMIHHPLLAVAGALAGGGMALMYARRQKLPLRTTADVLAAPVAVGLAFEQLGALLAGSEFGSETGVSWAVTYTNPLAARWSGTPLGISLHPVQAYAALAFLALSVLLVVWLPARRQQGEVAGLGLMGAGVSIFITELWRDPEGRGVVLGGALDGPQLAVILMVLAGGFLLLERSGVTEGRSFPPIHQEQSERMRHGAFSGRGAKDEGSNG
ncbi:MAG: prolipoprotein diacylglyceryl transferase family protein [Terracidiphilus sp.]